MYINMFAIFYFYSCVDGHSGYLQILAIVTNHESRCLYEDFIFVGDNSEEQILGNVSVVSISIVIATSLYVLIHTYWISLFFTLSTTFRI